MTALGFVIRPEHAPEELPALAAAVEDAGFDELWLWEDCFYAGGTAATTAALAATSRIQVGLGIMPAPVRNPVFAAMEIAALARLYPGRLHAGFGHGVADWMRQVGSMPKSPLAMLEETVAAVDAEHFALKLAFFRYLRPEIRLMLLERRRAYLQDKLAQFKANLRDYRERIDSYSLSLQRHAMASTESDIAWIDELITQERSPQNASGLSGPQTDTGRI